MLTFSRALRFLPVFVLAYSLHLRAQDMPIRVEAIRLMERANGVSQPGNVVLNRKFEVTFRTYRLDGTTQDGVFNVIRAGDIERFETIFGDYHAISIHYPDRIVQNDYEPPPPESLEVDGLTPLLIGEFDKSDTIHSITPATLFGRRAKCIHFETVNGRAHQSNEICVDDDTGALIRWNVGEDLVENTEYSSSTGILLPTHIRHYINGKLRMEIEQKVSVIDGPIDWAALTPPNPTTLRSCQEYRRPIIQSAPQPATAGAGPWYDIQVHGVIGEDGHVHEAAVLAGGRDDLEKQAVQIVSGWVFSPGVCNGKPVPVVACVVVHFPPQ